MDVELTFEKREVPIIYKMYRSFLYFLTFFFILIGPSLLSAQEKTNYRERDVPDYTLPDIFITTEGDSAHSLVSWETIRRPEIIRLFEENVYGTIPKDFDHIAFHQLELEENPYPDISILKQVDIEVGRNGNNHSLRLDLFIPTSGQGPYPVFLFINHRENLGLQEHIETEFWPVPALLARGYAVGTIYAEDLAPDDKSRYKEGILNNLYPEQLEMENGMRALGAWGWGAMRTMDYFEQDPDIDAGRSALVGHSRGGKAALWTSANDPRWAITIANGSGAAGAALSRRKFGETVEDLNRSFPHWFSRNFKAYNGLEEELPIDQHMLIATIAPRAVYISSATKDQWADPRGEYLALKHASVVYPTVYGLELKFPEIATFSEPVLQKYAGYHIKVGNHSLTLFDWERFMDFADVQFN